MRSLLGFVLSYGDSWKRHFQPRALNEQFWSVLDWPNRTACHLISELTKSVLYLPCHSLSVVVGKLIDQFISLPSQLTMPRHTFCPRDLDDSVCWLFPAEFCTDIFSVCEYFINPKNKKKNKLKRGKKRTCSMLNKILMCMVMKCGAAPCHLHLVFTTWQLVMPHSSSHMCCLLLWANREYNVG